MGVLISKLINYVFKYSYNLDYELDGTCMLTYEPIDTIVEWYSEEDDQLV